MPPEVLKAANSGVLWGIAVLIVSIVLFQSFAYIRHSFKVAAQLGFEREKCMLGLRVGMTSAIGPSIGVFIIMVGMMSVVGAPITWLRLSVIGAAHTELTAATVGAQALGVQFGSPQYDLTALATSFWTMTVNGTGWLLFCLLATPHLDKIRDKMGGGDSKWIAFMSGAAMLGCFAYLNTNIVAGTFRTVEAAVAAGKTVALSDYASLAAILGGLFSMIVLVKLSQTRAWLREYALGIALLLGIVTAFVVS